MRLTSIKIKNFRLLEDIEVGIDEIATLIVGRNNSGKTSLVNVFDKFFGDEDCTFVLEDFPAARIADIKQAHEWWAKAEHEEPADGIDPESDLHAAAVGLLPQMTLQLTVTYDEKENLAALSGMILDLDEECRDVVIEAVLEADQPENFLAEYHTAASHQELFVEHRWLRSNFLKFFKTSFYAVSVRGNPPARRPIKKSVIDNVLSVQFIYAQNKLDDSGTDRTRNLSKSFEDFHRAHSEDAERNHNIDGIDAALLTASQRVDKSFAALFTPIFDDLNRFGVGNIEPVRVPKVVTKFDATSVFRGSTRIEYPAETGDMALPEGHHGLGYSKLIFTIVRIVDFYETHRRAVPRPAIQLLFIEEPEAHLHPQMQEAFIANIRDFLRTKDGWNVQVIVTTHSPHIMMKSGFECVRYFDRWDPGARVRDLQTFQQLAGATTDGQDALRFLQQYMELRPCDMFFADKIILVEGTVERLLLPEMIKRCAPTLAHKYLSVIEVGGAYALKFRELLSFLSVQTLVITDLDSGTLEGHHKACEPSTAGAVTTNATLKSWLPAERDIATLLEIDDAAKTKGHVRVAYQVPEQSGGPVGRSFEDAFILANAHILAAELAGLSTRKAFIADTDSPSAEMIAESAYKIADGLHGEKTGFAFDVLRLDGWSVPRYIDEGLRWLE
ncbi:ATP-dependent OLD family endonuclease [Catenulispora acidiphila DSM 44928]|uniref:ATP-dependent OLD family endonuclease n=1 Tax=Catenulispora acidiphila (strain DSM 44928 / JCM 14897 / NBRC 102108 / NRRL B-24433 / ID139908) TaxID=479433 RepID=C7Q3I3_CATAD|nr:AAA family ATPase [Catenulispora acidiphila]ACU75748.1 ATP-dependent OLD family endonuclease [Catenulispora acidiphila DSM 44928]